MECLSLNPVLGPWRRLGLLHFWAEWGGGTGGAQVGQGGGGFRTYPASDKNDEQLMEFQGKESLPG